MVPKVSIIIPCYNSEKWIHQSLMSALSQTWKNTEVIFVDNESTDNSVEIANRIFRENPHLKMARAENIFPNCWDEAKEVGFEMMTGDYVLVMGSDDFLHTKYIENCMRIISFDPDRILALQSPMRGVKENSSNIVNEIRHEYKSVEEFKKQCLERCPVNTPTVIYNRRLWDDGLLDTQPDKYGGAADYDLYCKLADNGVMIYPAPNWLGFFYRWHSEQATWKVQKEEKNYDKMIQDYWREKWEI